MRYYTKKYIKYLFGIIVLSLLLSFDNYKYGRKKSVVLVNESQLSGFGLFQSKFPNKSLPFQVQNAVLLYNRQDNISPNFKEFLPNMDYSSYSRDALWEYATVGVLYKNKNFNLLAYSLWLNLSYDEDSFTRYSVYLATYTPSGSPIENFEFAKKAYPDSFVSGLIKPDLSIELRTTKKIWKDNAYENGGYIKLNLKRVEETTAYYQIDREGHFVKLKELLAEPKQGEKKLGMLR